MVGAALLLIATPEVFARSASMESVPDAKVLNYRPVRFGDYEVYYSAFKSTFIPPETAEMYSLMRGEKYGIINIAVRNIKDSETGKAVTSTVSGEQQNLMTQVKKLTFREVKEGSAIYYLADFKFSDEELLKFTIDVKPQGGQRAETIQFEQTFYE
ncbi:hypothetical protein ACH42_09225 [Endozoicomonas sp. (ex Bugula neritina AB1)]|nr:hypothetical protein ACH42_09225 [Endozoicomonas sp. (ex Bugula neritina AB1)]